jgi:hypothetical protein
VTLKDRAPQPAGPHGTRLQPGGPHGTLSDGPPTPTQLGRYRLIRVIGVGGMGTVHLGRTPGGRSVAVKVVHPVLAANADFRARFRREIALARQVGGPFTAAVLDADPEHDPPWLATEYTQGLSLAEVVAAHGPLPEHSVRALAAGLSEALEVIHGAGIVHRDLKPSNVLLSAEGPRVIDFGVAKALEGIDLTTDGRLLGTPGYMSPEHLAGSPLDGRSDVFSLGAVLAYAAGGVAPFGSGQTFASAHRVMAEPPDLRAVPDALRAVIGRCVAKDPADRPAVAALLAEFGEFAATPGDLEDRWLPPAVDTAVRTAAQPEPAQPEPAQPAPAQPAPAEHAPKREPRLVAVLADRFEARITPVPVPPHRPRPDQLPPVPHPVAVAARRLVTARAAAKQHGPGFRWDVLPPRTPAQLTRWSRWGAAVGVLALIDGLAQFTSVRSLFAPGGPKVTAPLSPAFEASAKLRTLTGWIPDPITSWILNGSSSDRVDARLIAVPVLLIGLLVLARGTSRGRRRGMPRAGQVPPQRQLPHAAAPYAAAPYAGARHPGAPYAGQVPPQNGRYRGAPNPYGPLPIWYPPQGGPPRYAVPPGHPAFGQPVYGAIPVPAAGPVGVGRVATVAAWLGVLLTLLLTLRYLHTGFDSLLWATATFGWWTLLAIPVAIVTVNRLTGTAKHR